MSSFERMQALRAIDANANRATEALRVLEDHARFVGNDRELAESLKKLRHELVAALDAIPPQERLIARDTVRDVGTELRTEAEYTRSNLSHVVIANWKRVQQAMRSLEEFSKPLSTSAAEQIEQLRYQLYSLEKLALARQGTGRRIENARLYVLCSGLDDERDFYGRIHQLVKAQVDVIQLRDKKLSDRQLLSRAKLVREATSGSDTLFMMNDRADIACLADADGVHVGQEELSVQDARLIVGPNKLVGVSTHTIEQALQAQQDGADYIGCGPIFPSATKTFEKLAGLELLREAREQVHIPAFAIGGITLDNIGRVLQAGGSRVAVQHAIWEAASPETAARQFRAAVEE